MSSVKKTAETPEAHKPSEVVDTIVALVEIPAKICVQIGQRKRYFGDTVDEAGKVTTGRENALAALKEFTERSNKVPGAGSRVCLTKEQKEAKAAVRAVLCKYAELQGKEGKNIAAMANALEDLVKQIPGVLALIEEYNVTPKTAEESVNDTSEPVVATEGGDALVTAVDPLAEFNM